MEIIRKEPNPSGAFPSPQGWGGGAIPEGYAAIADTVDMADFYAYNGFVSLTIEPVECYRQVRRIGTEGGEVVVSLVHETYTVDTVTAYTPNVEAWEAWKASQPTPKEPEPTFEDDAAAMLVDHEYRLALLEAGLF